MLFLFTFFHLSRKKNKLENSGPIMTKNWWYDRFNTFHRRKHNMFKKYRLIVTLLIVGLIGGAFTQQVDASASAEDSTKGNDTQQYIVKHNHDQRWEMFIKKCFGKWYTNKHQHEAMNPQDENEQENQKQDEPKVPTTEQEDMQEQEKVEQPEQPKEEVEQPEEEVEQPEQQEQVDSDLHPFEQQVVELTNVERTKQGLAPRSEERRVGKEWRKQCKTGEEKTV